MEKIITMENLYELPLTAQIVLAFGYIGYRLSCSGVGMRVNHTATDITFQTFIFGSLSVLFAYIINLTGWITFEQKDYWHLFIGGILSLIVPIWWSKKGKENAIKLLRRFNNRVEDGAPSAWDSVLNGREGWWHIDVYLNNGDIFESAFESIPKEWPHNNGHFSHTGDLAIYVTAITKGGKEKSIKFDKTKTYPITCIPASSIKYIKLQLEKSN